MTAAPLVLLHGYTGSPASWAPVLAELGPAVETFAPALVGHDPSATVEGPELDVLLASDASRAFDAEVARIAALVTARGLRGAHVCGYSLGGRVALGALVRHPGLFARATLVGAHPGLEDEQARSDRRASDAAWIRLALDGLGAFLDAWERQPIFATQARARADRRAAQDAIRRAHSASGLAQAMWALGLGSMPNLRPFLADIDVPVDLVIGAEDEKFRRVAARMCELLPVARLTVVPNVGHNVLLEAPEALARALEAPAPLRSVAPRVVRSPRAARITWAPFTFALPGAPGNARTAWSTRDGLVVRIETDDATGWGEVAPLPGYSTESLAACVADLERLASGPLQFDVDARASVVELVSAALAPVGELAPAARFGVETALLDVLAQVRGVPLHALLGDAPAVAVPISTMTSAVTEQDAMRAAEGARARKIRVLKMKVGRAGAFEDELAIAKAVSAAFGDLTLRFDVNGAWSIDEARELLPRLLALRPDLVEEPVAAADWAAFAPLAPRGAPLALDESLQAKGGERLVDILAAHGILRAVVLKPGALGGLLRCHALARRASALGVAAVTSHLFDGPIGTAAAVELALALKDALPAGLDAEDRRSAWPDPGPPQLRADAAVPHDGLGLGTWVRRFGPSLFRD